MWGCEVGVNVFLCSKQTLKSKITLPAPCKDTVLRDHYIFMRVYVGTAGWTAMSKRACHTITNYLNENHRQVRQIITECARTYISGPAMQNWICKRHIYFLCCLLLLLSLSFSISIIYLFPCSWSLLPTLSVKWLLLVSLHLSQSTCQIEYISSLTHIIANTNCHFV